MFISRLNKHFFIAATSIISLIFSCDSRDNFTIKGEIEGGEGKMLYLSNVGILKTQRLDSVKLGRSGKFEFKQPRPECYDFYRLQLDGKGRQITIAIDSTETVTVRSNAAHFADSCKIEGSPESVKIQEIAALERALQQQVTDIIELNAPEVGETRATLYNLLDEFKRNICSQYIIPAPDKASAYYSLYLRINGQPIFDPLHNRFDSKCFSAVATSLDNRYPHTTRAMQIYNTAIKGMKATRPVTKQDSLFIPESKIKTISLFDVNLPNIDGDSIRLTSLKGKVVLLDFTIYSNAQISVRHIELRELYNRYKEQGFEIYQISYDADKHFWQTAADNLPWVCVRDDAGVVSQYTTLYRVEKIPTFFLINRNNELVWRDEQISDLNKTIEELLKEK
ncbi:MAG: AhpC/TSA family protein [Bacteroidaceae bacterium]|nr:AhpC/TSA family protein [Bacteroidaceae bacterium]